MSVVEQVLINFVLVHCYKCGVAFQVTARFDETSRRDERSFYCPNGHGQIYSGKSEAEKLREQLKLATEARQRAESARQFAENSNRVYKGHLTRLKRRVSGGVCPCCNRSFVALGRHMKTQHPDYSESKP